MAQASGAQKSEADRREGINAWLYEYQPQADSRGAAGFARGLWAALFGPLLVIGGILLAIVSLFLVAYLALDHNFMAFSANVLGIAALTLLLLGSWYSFSRASVEFDSTLELAG